MKLKLSLKIIVNFCRSTMEFIPSLFPNVAPSIRFRVVFRLSNQSWQCQDFESFKRRRPFLNATTQRHNHHRACSHQLLQFLATLVALDLTLVSLLTYKSMSKWAEFQTSEASRLASLLFRFHNCAEEVEAEATQGVKAMGTRVNSDDRYSVHFHLGTFL